MPSRLAVCGALAPAVFTVGWVVGGLIEPGHDIRRQDVSSLAAKGADHAWIVLAAICLTGALVVALAAGLALERGRWPALLAPLVGAGGVAIALHPRASRALRGASLFIALVSPLLLITTAYPKRPVM